MSVLDIIRRPSGVIRSLVSPVRPVIVFTTQFLLVSHSNYELPFTFNYIVDVQPLYYRSRPLIQFIFSPFSPVAVHPHYLGHNCPEDQRFLFNPCLNVHFIGWKLYALYLRFIKFDFQLSHPVCFDQELDSTGTRVLDSRGLGLTRSADERVTIIV